MGFWIGELIMPLLFTFTTEESIISLLAEERGDRPKLPHKTFYLKIFPILLKVENIELTPFCLIFTLNAVRKTIIQKS
jgi:hypothetical protein